MSRRPRNAARALVAALALAAYAEALGAQESGGAARLHELVRGLTVTPRVLVIGARPDDDVAPLLAWLARGRMVQTAFLSLTRGEAGQNFLGAESGTALGAVRTQEILASRRIDGAEQFFSRAYDVGFARNSAEVFKHWPRDTVISDIVWIVRSFRPHVIVVATDSGSRVDDGQRQALAEIELDIFNAAADTMRWPASKLGLPWTPSKLYRLGNELTIDASEFNAVLGKTYDELAAMSRAQRRSEGFIDQPVSSPRAVRLHRVASRGETDGAASEEKSIFDGVDTSFARLAAGGLSGVVDVIPQIAASADSARAALDLQHPDRAVSHLARVAQLAGSLRGNAPWCRHPTQDAAPPSLVKARCAARWLDLDASVDLLRRRANEALLLAAGVTVTATIDRELVADGDTAVATITLTNHGTSPVTLVDATAFGSTMSSGLGTVAQPDSAVHVLRTVTGLANAQPWWIGSGKSGARFPAVLSTADGMMTPGPVMGPLSVLGMTVPENIRRQSDIMVTVLVAGTTVTTSVGPLVYRYADAIVGVQDRVASGVPPVTLQFDHSLEWFPANKPINRSIRLTLKSFSDVAQTFTFKVYSPPGIRADSLPASVTLAPREQRELFFRLRGTTTVGRLEFGIVGIPARPAGGKPKEPLASGFQTVQYAHLPPVRLFHSSGMYLQAIDINVPQQLGALYVKGVGDDIPAALKQVGVSNFVVPAEDLLSVPLSQVTTIVLGRGAYETHPELVAQNGRLLDFVRQGGTLVIQQNGAAMLSRVLPYPVTMQRINPERIATADAPVTALQPKSRLLSWPNAITDDDWKQWASGRAGAVPTTADPRYNAVVEMHDADQPANRNTILVARLGKGTLIYTPISFAEQIAGGVGGSLRLLVNLLSGSVSGKIAQ